MSDDAYKDAEKRGYAKGYLAGQKRKQRQIDAEARQRRSDALWLRFYVSMLPTAMSVQGWTISDVKVTNTVQRVELAARWADEALKKSKQRVFV